MNRRSFMKKVGGALAGVVALALPSKGINEFDLDKLDPKMANIDPNSEWAKQTIYEGRYTLSVWDRQLSQSEIAQIHREPFAMFKKPIEPVLNPNHPLSRGLVLY